jgi:large subunit ribosomal protein L2
MKIKNYIYKKKKIKTLSLGVNKLAGRGRNGSIILYHRGGGIKKKYILVDFNKCIYNISGVVLRIEYDSKRSAVLNLIGYFNGILCYSLAIRGLRIGDTIFFKDKNYLSLGCTNFLKNIKLGYYVCLVELYYKCGAQYSRAAGSFAKIILKKFNYCILRLKSKVLIKLPILNVATIGVIEGFDFRFR